MRFIHGLFKSELKDFCTSAQWPAFRCDQLWNWLYVRRVARWDAMTNLPRAMREVLAGEFRIDAATMDESASLLAADGTRRLLARLTDGDSVEEVLIPARGRNTVCVSTQVGCRFNCAFCASGQAGFRRHLAAGEIVGEVLLASAAFGARPSHVVFMGIGEPLDNYDEVIRAVRILNDGDGLAIGARRLTLSTCGVVPGIRRLAGEGLQIELSVSLHAPNDAVRSRLMPVNRRWPVAELLAACADYTRATKRIVTFEYTLIRGCNDSPEHARELADLLRRFPCRANLIPLSPVEEFDGRAPDERTARGFQETLTRAGVNTTLRTSRGAGAKAACGQLRFRRDGATPPTEPHP
jgi:23S rRNA (adenine2503-C2)-methyltransferase